MDSLRLRARDGEAVRQATELGEIAPMETAGAELTDAFPDAPGCRARFPKISS